MSTIEVNPFAAWGPRDYVKLPEIPDSWVMADIGPGGLPHPRANVYIDYSQDILDAIDLRPGQQAILGNIEDGLPEIPDNAFSFVWISHVLEHCRELQKCIDALNRISKRGIVTVPSFAKDSLLHFQERAHFWHCLKNPTQGGPIVFVEHCHGFIERLREDQLAQQAASFLYQTGSHHDCTAERHMRSWWQKHEPDLDIVHEWGPRSPLKAIIIR